MSDKPTVIETLTAVMAEVQSVGKGQRNLEQGYNFRGVDAVVNAVGPALRKHGVIVLPMLEKASYRDVTTSKGKPSRESTVEVRYRFYGPAGDFVDAVVPGESMDVGDKGVAKAMSVAYRIVLLQALCIPTDEPDPDSQSYERGNAWEAAKPPTDEQVARFDAIRGSIAVATTQEHLAAAWAAVVAAYRADELTTVQANMLRTELGERKEKVDDSASDSDGGGAGAQSAGPGTGPDGEGAGERGPGRDGEAGDDRNAPAAAGGGRG